MKPRTTSLTLTWLIRAMVVFAFFSGVNSANGQVFDWGVPNPGSDWSQPANHSQTDASGNTYCAGIFSDQITIGTTFFPAPPAPRIYLAKYDSTGSVIWARDFATISAYNLEVNDMETDSAGNLYLAGQFGGQIQLDQFSFSSPNFGNDMFLAKLSPNGNVIWATQGEGNGYNNASSLSLDASGNMFVSGYLQDTAFSYNGQTIPGIGNAFILKANNNGQTIWSKRIDAVNITYAAGASGNGVVSGNFTTTINLGNGVSLSGGTNAGALPVFVAGIDSSGQFHWGHLLHGSGQIFVHAMKASPTGDFVIAGTFRDSVFYNGAFISSSSINDLFLLKTSAAGTAIWLKKIVRMGFDAQLTMNLLCYPALEVAANGAIVVANAHIGALQLNDSVWHYPIHSTSQEIAVVKYAANGDLLFAKGFGSNGQEQLSGLGLDAAGNIYINGYLYGFAASGPVFFSGTNMSFFVPGGISGILCKILANGNKISGRVFIDLNNSGIPDPGEPGLPAITISTQSGLYFNMTDNNGHFEGYVNSGTHLINISQPFVNYNLSPASQIVNFPGLGQTDSLNNFALQPIGSVQDLQVSIVQLDPARPGFPYRNRITYHNVGTVPVSGTIKYLADNILSFQSALPASPVVNADTLSWNFANLQPLETRHITVEWQVPATTALGTTLNLLAIAGPLTADPTPADNHFIDSTTVTGSYDPNDKLVSHAKLSSTQVTNQQPLTYTVRFQNTGTDTAFAVMVRDELSDLLNMATLEVLSASHTFTAELIGQHVIHWKFSNILLPDSNTNEPASHGYIQYRIKPFSSLTVGQHINTSAGIYFDFNLPVLTNITNTEVVLVNAVAADIESSKLNLFPNPTSGSFTLQLSKVQPGQVQVRVLNMLGQEVYQKSATATSTSFEHKVQLQQLPEGIYLLHVQQGEQSLTKRIVLQR